MEWTILVSSQCFRWSQQIPSIFSEFWTEIECVISVRFSEERRFELRSVTKDVSENPKLNNILGLAEIESPLESSSRSAISKLTLCLRYSNAIHNRPSMSSSS